MVFCFSCFLGEVAHVSVSFLFQTRQVDIAQAHGSTSACSGLASALVVRMARHGSVILAVPASWTAWQMAWTFCGLPLFSPQSSLGLTSRPGNAKVAVSASAEGYFE